MHIVISDDRTATVFRAFRLTVPAGRSVAGVADGFGRWVAASRRQVPTNRVAHIEEREDTPLLE
jgi:hypothetical protein